MSHNFSFIINRQAERGVVAILGIQLKLNVHVELPGQR